MVSRVSEKRLGLIINEVYFLMVRFGEYITGGTEKSVYKDADHPDSVIKKYREGISSPHKAIARGYMGKLLHILRPNNFPDVHLSSPDLLVVEKKMLDSEHKIAAGLLDSNKDLSYLEDEHNEDRKKLLEYNVTRDDDVRIKELKADMDVLGIGCDPSPVNFAFDQEGSPVYVDNVEPWDTDHLEEKGVNPHFDPDRLSKAIEAIQDGEQKRKAKFYFERLTAHLEKEEERLSKGNK